MEVRALIPQVALTSPIPSPAMQPAPWESWPIPKPLIPCWRLWSPPMMALLEALGALGWQEEDGSAITDREPLLKIVRSYGGHERPLIRSAAYRSLLQLTREDCWGEQLVHLLQHNELQVRRAALLDLGVTGWRPAGAAVARTLAENSLKLIALRAWWRTARRGTRPAHPPHRRRWNC